MRTRTLQELVEASQGMTYGRYASERGEVFRYLQVGNLQSGQVMDSAEMKQERLDAEAVESAIPREGMILVSLRTPDLRTAVVAHDMPQHVVSNNLTILRVKSDDVRPTFIGLVLQSEVMRQRLTPLYKGDTIRSLSLKDLKQVTIDVPSLDVQDRFIEAQQALIEQERAYQELTELRRREFEAHIAPFAGGLA